MGASGEAARRDDFYERHKTRRNTRATLASVTHHLGDNGDRKIRGANKFLILYRRVSGARGIILFDVSIRRWKNNILPIVECSRKSGFFFFFTSNPPCKKTTLGMYKLNENIKRNNKIVANVCQREFL